MILAKYQVLVAIIANLFGTLMCFGFFFYFSSCKCAHLMLLHFVIVLSELLKFHYKYMGTYFVKI